MYQQRWTSAGLRIVGLALCFVPVLAWAQAPPLRDRVDAAVAAMLPGPVAGRADDADLARRTYLCLVGRAPTVEELDAYLELPVRQRQETTVQRLLDSGEFAAYFAAVLDIWLMERRTGNRIPEAEWRQFLARCLQERWTLDRLIQTIVSADGSGENRPAARFLLDREVEPNALTRDISRIFMGRDLQCAQCHDHPNIADYFQSEYYGIFAFVSRSYLFENPAENKKPYVGEKGEGEVEFKSVFFPEEGERRALPSLLGMFELSAEPNFVGMSASITEADKQHAGRPKFSRRKVLGRYLTHPDNMQAARNWANRLWAHMFGRGLVHPVDFHHPDNPPKLPELLDALATDLIASGWDLRHLLAELALSQTFARSIDLPPMPDVSMDRVDALYRAAEAELARLESQSQASEELRRRQAIFDAQRAELEAIDTRLDELQKERQTLLDAAATVDKQVAAAATKDEQAAAGVEKLKGEVEAADRAARAAPENPDLAAAVDRLRTKLKKSEESAAAARTALQAVQKERATVRERMAALEQSLEELRWSRVVAADLVAEARGALRAVTRKHERTYTQRMEMSERLAVLVAYRTLAQRSIDQGRAAADLASAQQQLAQFRQQIASLDAAIGDRTRQHAELEQRIASDRATLQARASELATRRDAIAALRHGLSAAHSAAEQLSARELQTQLDATAPQVVALEQQLTAEAQRMAVEEARIAESLSAAEASADEIRAMRSELASRQSEAQRQSDRIEQLKQEVVDAQEAFAAAQEQWYASVMDHGGVRRLVPLSPEQLSGATIIGLGLADRFRAEAEAEWNKAHQDKQPEEIDPDQRTAEIDRLYGRRVDAVTTMFVQMFAAPAGAPQDAFSATVDQALFLANDGRVQNWLSPTAGSLTQRLSVIEDPAEMARQLYRNLLSRAPTPTEVENVASYLQSRAEDRSAAIRELVWGVFTSLEFRFQR